MRPSSHSSQRWRDTFLCRRWGHLRSVTSLLMRLILTVALGGATLGLSPSPSYREAHCRETWDTVFFFSLKRFHSGSGENHSEWYQQATTFWFFSFCFPINIKYFIKLSALLLCQEFYFRIEFDVPLINKHLFFINLFSFTWLFAFNSAF